MIAVLALITSTRDHPGSRRSGGSPSPSSASRRSRSCSGCCMPGSLVRRRRARSSSCVRIPRRPISATRSRARFATRRSRSRTGCREFRSWADLDGRPVELPSDGQRASDDADRPRRGARGGAAARPGAATTSPSCSTPSPRPPASRSRTAGCTPSCRARLRRARGLARADHRRRPEGAPATRAQPARRRAAAADRALARAEPARGALERRSRSAARASTRRGARSRPRSRSCAMSRAASTRPSSAGTGWRSRSSSSPRGRRCRSG